MAVDERSRHELYLKLEETLGPDAATTLMEHLPGVGWADVATKHDLDGLRRDRKCRPKGSAKDKARSPRIDQTSRAAPA